MRIYLNREPVKGPWGGGNKLVEVLTEKLENLGHRVDFVFRSDVEVVFCFDPRPNKYGDTYEMFLDYKECYPETKIIQRVSDLGTHGKPDLTSLVKETITQADWVVFPSDWAKRYSGYKKKNYSILQNAPLEMFYKHRKKNIKKIDSSKPIKIVTHHWSDNKKKGFELYKKFDEHNKLGDWYRFTFVGRVNKDYNFETSTVIEPKPKEFLSKILSKQHIYLTASEEEAGANHVLEAMAAGLPVVYSQDGGSVPEYCEGYGVEYHDFKSMIAAIEKIAFSYEYYKNKVLSYDDSCEKLADKYVELILKVYEEKT